MKVTLPNGTSIEGTAEELERLGYLPPAPKYNWDGSPAVTCGGTPHWIPPGRTPCDPSWDPSIPFSCLVGGLRRG